MSIENFTGFSVRLHALGLTNIERIWRIKTVHLITISVLLWLKPTINENQAVMLVHALWENTYFPPVYMAGDCFVSKFIKLCYCHPNLESIAT